MVDIVRYSPVPDAPARPKSDTYRPDLQFSTHERRRVALGDNVVPGQKVTPVGGDGPTGSGGGGTGGRRADGGKVVKDHLDSHYPYTARPKSDPKDRADLVHAERDRKRVGVGDSGVKKLEADEDEIYSNANASDH